MSGLLRIRWAIAPEIAPRPLINCNRCGDVRPYRYGGKFRVNANGKRIDAWMIYRCVDCDNSWNFTLFERRNRRDIEPALLAALEGNEPVLARRIAFDAAALGGRAGRFEGFSETTLQKKMMEGNVAGATGLRLELRLEAATSLRLDRLLATQLGISRTRLRDLEARKLLTVAPKGAKALRKPVCDGLAIRIDLAGEADRDAVISAACG